MRSIYLMGGEDLEMQTIGELFSERQIPVVDSVAAALALNVPIAAVDLGLSWGAKLSDFGTLQPDVLWIGLELMIDVDPPIHWMVMDHHGDLPPRPTTLEQVADRLGIPLNEHLTLIAINDASHISGLIAAGCNEEEWNAIRSADRAAQGVTPAMESEAAQAYEQEIARLPSQVPWRVVQSSLKRFSPLVDRLHGCQENLLIFGHSKWTAFGPRCSEVLDHDKNLGAPILTKEYSGGGEAGFAGGLIEGAVDEVDVLARFRTMEESNKEVYSRHVLMLPVALESKPSDAVDGHWESWNEVGDQLVHSYNTEQYFLPHARRVLFGGKGDEEGLVSVHCLKDGHGIMRIQSPNDLQDDFILRFVRIERRVYTLDLKNASRGKSTKGNNENNALRVGILAIHLVNDKYPGYEDILDFSQLMRRLYSAFYYTQGSSYERRSKYELIERQQTHQVPKHVELIRDNGEALVKMSFADADFRKLGFMEQLLDRAGFIPKSEANPILDDRMFLVSWVGIESSRLKRWKQSVSPDEHAVDDVRKADSELSDQDLYRLAYVDASSEMTCPHAALRTELLNQALYLRWAPLGTFYATTRYSFIAATDYEPVLNGQHADFVIDHTMTMYRHMALLTLVQRAYLVLFSNRIAAIIRKDTGEGGVDQKKVRTEIKEFRNQFNHYLNRVSHREITAQEQGIELYDRMQKVMRIKEQIDDLRTEIDHTDSVAEASHQDSLQLSIDNLTRYSLMFAWVAIVSGFLGVNVVLENGRGLFSQVMGWEEPRWLYVFVQLDIILTASVLGMSWIADLMGNPDNHAGGKSFWMASNAWKIISAIALLLSLLLI